MGDGWFGVGKGACGGILVGRGRKELLGWDGMGDPGRGRDMEDWRLGLGVGYTVMRGGGTTT
jgi:hypothetical protein